MNIFMNELPINSFSKRALHEVLRLCLKKQSKFCCCFAVEFTAHRHKFVRRQCSLLCIGRWKRRRPQKRTLHSLHTQQCTGLLVGFQKLSNTRRGFEDQRLKNILHIQNTAVERCARSDWDVRRPCGGMASPLNLFMTAFLAIFTTIHARLGAYLVNVCKH